MTDESWKGDNLDADYKDFKKYLRDLGFSYLGEGSFRVAFHQEDKVIKVPITSDGLIDNMVEARAWKKYRNRPTPGGLYLTPCRLLRNGCLMMMKVKRDELYDRPEWAFKIDGYQVGIYKGRYVAYDYALEIPERFEWEKEWKKHSKFFNSPDWEKQTKSPQVRDYLRNMRLEKVA